MRRNMSKAMVQTRSPRTLLVAAMVLLVASVYLAIPAVSQAGGGENFCKNAWLNRYGQSNDYCTATPWHYNYFVKVASQEHSACVSTTTNSNKTGVNFSWVCTPGPWGYAERQTSMSVLTHGIIRNNTTGDTNHATGSETYCDYPFCEEP